MQRPNARADICFALALAMISMGAGLIVHQTTRFGSGLRDDSFVYMSSAEGIAKLRGYGREAGDGSLRPTTGFPPVYSVSLAILSWLGFDLHAGVRVLGAVGFSALVFLAGLGAAAVTRSAGFALLCAALVLASPTLIEAFGWALSESVYLPLSLAAILATTQFLARGNVSRLVFGGLAAGVAMLTRYAGFALVVALGVCLAVNLGRAGHRRWRAWGMFAALCLGPTTVFLVRNMIVSGGLANRPRLSWRPPEAGLMARAAEFMARWLAPMPGMQLPDWLSFALASLMLLGFMIVAVWGLRAASSLPVGRRWPELPWMQIALGMHAMAYLTLLLASMTIADPNIQAGFEEVGERLLAPLHLDLMLLITLLLYSAWKRGKSSRQQIPIAVGLIFLIAQVTGGVDEVADLQKDGRGFNSAAWRSSRAMAYIRQLPELPIYTNNVAAVYLLAGKRSSFIPQRYNLSTRSLRSDYPQDLERMQTVLREHRGILAILGDDPRGRLEPDYLAELRHGLTLVEAFPDGLIYRYTGDG